MKVLAFFICLSYFSFLNAQEIELKTEDLERICFSDPESCLKDKERLMRLKSFYDEKLSNYNMAVNEITT